jgi:hypothetical protein
MSGHDKPIAGHLQQIEQHALRPIKPRVIEHDDVFVVRDDLFPGGTKARFLPSLFDGAEELGYASPAEGGAQTALATVASQLGKRATIFVAERKREKWHDRTLMAQRLCAQIMQVSPGYLTVVQARARQYSHHTGALLAPFGFDMPGALQAIAQAARSIGEEPDEVWRASLSMAKCVTPRVCIQYGAFSLRQSVSLAPSVSYLSPQCWAQRLAHSH